MCRLLGVPSNLMNLLSNKMELGRKGHFYDFGSVQAIPANIGRLQIKTFYIARYPSTEGNMEQNFEAMD